MSTNAILFLITVANGTGVDVQQVPVKDLESCHLTGQAWYSTENKWRKYYYRCIEVK